MLVCYHQSIAGIFLVDMQLTNKVDEPVDSQHFFHTLQDLRYKVQMREFDEDIRILLVNALKNEPKRSVVDWLKGFFTCRC